MRMYIYSKSMIYFAECSYSNAEEHLYFLLGQVVEICVPNVEKQIGRHIEYPVELNVDVFIDRP